MRKTTFGKLGLKEEFFVLMNSLTLEFVKTSKHFADSQYAVQYFDLDSPVWVID